MERRFGLTGNIKKLRLDGESGSEEAGENV